MFNKVIILGNLTRDIELRYLTSGVAVAKTGIATSRKYKDKSGASREETLFIDIVVWGRAAEVANQFLGKGSRVLIEGRLTLEQWENDGHRRSKHVITVDTLKMLDRQGAESGGDNHGGQSGGYGGGAGGGRPQAQNYQSQPQQQAPAQEAPNQTQSLPEIDIDEDDIPF